jgi:hypothetical protein
MTIYKHSKLRNPFDRSNGESRIKGNLDSDSIHLLAGRIGDDRAKSKVWGFTLAFCRIVTLQRLNVKIFPGAQRWAVGLIDGDGHISVSLDK